MIYDFDDFGHMVATSYSEEYKLFSLPPPQKFSEPHLLIEFVLIGN